MNRQIKFRGRTLPSTWLYGNLVQIDDDCRIQFKDSITDADSGKIMEFYRSVSVDPGSIGQFTGLHDRNGKEVYEGDVVFWLAPDIRGRYRGEQGAIIWDKHTMAWAIERDRPCADGRPCIISRPFDKKRLEVVGNIHDNPELMGNEQSKS